MAFFASDGSLLTIWQGTLLLILATHSTQVHPNQASAETGTAPYWMYLKTRLCPRFIANMAFLKYKAVSEIGTSVEMISKHLPFGVEAAKAVLAKAQDWLLISAKPVMAWRPFMCLFNIAITLVSLQVKARGLLH